MLTALIGNDPLATLAGVDLLLPQTPGLVVTTPGVRMDDGRNHHSRKPDQSVPAPHEVTLWFTGAGDVRYRVLFLSLEGNRTRFRVTRVHP